MRRSMLFCETLRQNPTDTEVTGHQLLLRGGFIQPLAAGIASLMPLGERVRRKIEQILREEMDAIDGQEISMPMVQPAELWQETGRWTDFGAELARFKDRGERDLVLGPTHEEVIADLLRTHVKSYRQLPLVLYQLQTKFRDEPRARGGLLRGREFIMKDAYSCDASPEGLDLAYRRMYQAYFNIFRRAGIEVIPVQSDVGAMGGTLAHEFMLVSSVGEDQIAICDGCGYAANRQVAIFRKEQPGPEEPEATEEVPTPGTSTIAALAELLDIPASRTAKAGFFMAGDRLIFAVVRGDMEVNETKLANAVKALELRPARPEELTAAGIVAGYASPVGMAGVTTVVDDFVATSPNLVAGANRAGYHLRNTNYGRDYHAEIVRDIVAVYDGAPCSRCGAPLHVVRGVEVGNIFKLGTKYTVALGATFLDTHGKTQPIIMGSYGIGVTRLIGAIAQEHRDERGLIWPVTIAPYHVYLVGLDLDDEPIRTRAEQLWRDLVADGVDVLYDDRKERAGVKFNDADLLGMPLRVTVSRRTLANDAVEIKVRAGGEPRQIPLAEARQQIRSALEAMRAAIMAKLQPEELVIEGEEVS